MIISKLTSGDKLFSERLFFIRPFLGKGVVVLALILFLGTTCRTSAAPISYRFAIDHGTDVAPMLQTNYPQCEASTDTTIIGLLKPAGNCEASGAVSKRKTRGRFFTLYLPPYSETTRVAGISLSARLENNSNAPGTIRFTLLATDPELGEEMPLGGVDQPLESGQLLTLSTLAFKNLEGQIPAEWSLALRADYLRGSSENLNISLADLTLTLEEEVIPCHRVGALSLQVGRTLSGDLVDLTSLDRSSGVSKHRYQVTAVVAGQPITVGPGISPSPFGANALEYNHETVVDLSGPATGTGIINRVQVYILDANGAGTMKFFTAGVSDTTIVPRDVATVTIAGSGLQTFTVDLAVEAGDFLGYYDGGAFIDQKSSGAGVLYGSDNLTGKESYFATDAPWSSNIQGTGAAPEDTVILFSGDAAAARQVSTTGWPAGVKQLTISGRDANCGTSLEPLRVSFSWTPGPPK